MTDGLSLALTVFSLGTGLVVAGSALAGRFRRRPFGPTLAVLQVGLVLQAALDVVTWVRGHRPGEPATHAAYLVASLLTLPLAAIETRRDDGTWSAMLLVVALVVTGVLVVRMQTTWRS